MLILITLSDYFNCFKLKYDILFQIREFPHLNMGLKLDYFGKLVVKVYQFIQTHKIMLLHLLNTTGWVHLIGSPEIRFFHCQCLSVFLCGFTDEGVHVTDSLLVVFCNEYSPFLSLTVRALQNEHEYRRINIIVTRNMASTATDLVYSPPATVTSCRIMQIDHASQKYYSFIYTNAYNKSHKNIYKLFL